MDSRITQRTCRARANFTESKVERKNESPERDFEAELTRIASLYGCLYLKIPDVVPIKRGGFMPVAHKRFCDGVLVTPQKNYLIEAKVGYNALLPHQLATQSKVNAINGSCYALRKKDLKNGTIYTVEQPEKVVKFKTDKIEKLFAFFQNPSNYFNHEIMKQGLDDMIPETKKRKLLNKVRV